MIEIEHPKDLARLRRHALSCQGLLQSQVFGRGLTGCRKTIQHLGYVQIDTISVVERAHHHVLYSRVPQFKPAMTNQMLVEGDIFEYWTHAAAFIPMSDFRFSLPYKAAIKSGQTHWFKNPDKKLMDNLLELVRTDGPIRSRDINTCKTKRAGWWDWKPSKKALEQLYMQGDLMVSDRTGFQKTYDLAERVLPSHIDTKMPSVEEFSTHILEQQLRCHGLVSIKGLTYQRRDADLRKAVSNLVNERLSMGTLEKIKLSSGEVFIQETGSLERPSPRLNNRVTILSPFDNSVIQRDRLRGIFNFDYQIECYIPAGKRQFGYFCLPLLYRDMFIGRMDCKAHRQERLLEIKSLYLERHSFDDDQVLAALSNAVTKFCQFQQCDRVRVTETYPKSLSPRLRRALNNGE